MIALAGWLNREQAAVVDYLREVNRILRELLPSKRIRLNDDQRRRLAVKGKALGRRLLDTCCNIVTPDTILRWHRKLIAAKYDGSANRGPGRPRVDAEICDLVVRMATENRSWGYRRIQGALSNLGLDVSESTVRRIPKDHGIEPAPERSRRMSWAEYLRSHLDSLAAADFFTVEAWSRSGLVRYAVFFVIELSSRRVEIAGIHPNPNGLWMVQVARNLTDGIDGFLREKRYLIHDRDPLYTAEFRSTLKSADVRSLKLPAESPILNPNAERFVRSMKSECLDRMIFFGVKHLRVAIAQFIEHYHRERNHQGIGYALIERPNEQAGDRVTPIECRSRLGGLLKFYHRAAA